KTRTVESCFVRNQTARKFSLLTLCFFLVNLGSVLGINQTNTLELRIKPGDVMVYRYTKIFVRNSDDPTILPLLITTVENKRVTVHLKVGSIVNITIVQVEPPVYQATYDNLVTTQNETLDTTSFFELVLPTTDNITYWQDHITNWSPFGGSGKVSLKDSTLTYNIVYSNSDWDILFEYSRNWKTGWLTRFYEKKSYKNGSLYGELDYTALEENISQTIGVEIFPSVIPLLVLPILAQRRNPR
ncbi:MAG: hypothetical protein ACFFFG_16875, partial [Candidatus Thorarchaeota archaeon]